MVSAIIGESLERWLGIQSMAGDSETGDSEQANRAVVLAAI